MLTIIKINFDVFNILLKHIKKITSGVFSYSSANNKAWGN